MNGSPVTVSLVGGSPKAVRLLQGMLVGPEFVFRVGEFTDSHGTEPARGRTHGEVILAELRTHEANWLETYRELTERISDLPVVALVNDDDQEIALAALRAGAQDCLDIEALDSGLLRSSIRCAIARHEAADRVGKKRTGTTAGDEDTTSHEQAEDPHRHLIEAIEQTSDIVLMTDTDGTISYANPAFARVTGFSCDEAIRRRLSALPGRAADNELYGQMWQTVTSGQTWRGRLTNEKKDGSRFFEEATVSPVRDALGNTVGYVEVGRDVTEQIVLQEQLRQSQRMEAIGRFSGGIAHDFSNLLTVIIGYAELLKFYMKHDDPLMRSVEEILKAGRRASDLTSRVLAFSRKAIFERRVVSLNAVLSDLERMLRRIIGEDVSLEVSLAANLLNVSADPTQIGQILLNLAANARDAMPDGGNLLVETRNTVIDQEHPGRYAGAKPGEYVLLSVSDTGTGMDEKTRAMIFEPFFSTKGEKGTGLGLSTVYGIVGQHDGYIWCETEPSKGTAFRMLFPATHEKMQKEEEESHPGQDRKGTATILVVEDEPSVMAIAATILDREGYEVLQAATGKDAIDLVERRTTPIDLLLSDIVLPDIRGSKVADRIIELMPEVRVLFASGYADDVIVNDGVLSPGIAFIRKPYGVTSLLKAVREVLGEDRG